MYILKNAWISIKRNISRNILVGIIIIVISASCTVTLAIKSTSSSLIASYDDAYQVEASIGFNRGNMMQKYSLDDAESRDDMQEEYNNIVSLTTTDIENYSNSNYVKSYYYTSSINLNGNNIEAASSNFGKGDKVPGNMSQVGEREELSADFSLTGYSTLESMEEFITGDYSLKASTTDAWKKIAMGNNCMINTELAELNDIEVGEEITLVDPNDSSLTYSLVVVGIFEENSSGDTISFSMFSNSSNNIITNANYVNDIVTNNTNIKESLIPTFILTSYEDTSKFEDELYDKGMSEYYILNTNEDEVKSATSTIANVSSFATTFLILTLVIGAIVLFIINQINIRERKYEIGVLRTIGMKKSKLTLQFLCELLIISIISMIIGLGLGACLSKPISNKLLENEINSSSEKVNDIKNNFNVKEENNNKQIDNFDFTKVKGVVSVQAYDKVDAVVDFKVVIELLFIGVLLTLIGSLSSMISIQKFSPLEILKERG